MASPTPSPGPTPRRHPRPAAAPPWLPPALLLCFALLRLLEARLLAPLLYSQELMGLGRLGWELQTSAPTATSSLPDLITAYQYGHFAPGTLLIQGLAAAIHPLLDSAGWLFHTLGLPFELLALGLTLHWLGRDASALRLVLVTSLWALLPAFFLGWQLMPFGNHTEFLWVIPALGLALEARGARALLALSLISALSILMYRGALLPVSAALLVGLLQRRWATLAAIAAGTLVAGATALALWALGTPSHPDETLSSLLLPRLAEGRTTATQALTSAAAFLGAPRGILAGAPWLLALVLGCGLAAERRDARTGYLATLVALGLGVPILLAPAHPEYLFPATAAGLLLLSRAVLNPGRLGTVAIGLALVASAAGAADLARLASTELWASGRGYAPLRLSHELALRSFQPQDLQTWSRLLEAEGSNRWIGLGTGGSPDRCPEQTLRLDSGPLPDLRAPACRTWSSGELGEWLAAYQEERGPIPAEGLRAVGAGAWVLCGQDARCVDRSVEGAPERTHDLVVRGARAAEVRARRTPPTRRD